MHGTQAIDGVWVDLGAAVPLMRELGQTANATDFSNKNNVLAAQQGLDCFTVLARADRVSGERDSTEQLNTVKIQ